MSIRPDFSKVDFTAPSTEKETREQWAARVKAETGVGSRCIPFEQKHISDKCVCCGKPAKHMVCWAIAY